MFRAKGDSSVFTACLPVSPSFPRGKVGQMSTGTGIAGDYLRPRWPPLNCCFGRSR